MKFRVSGAPVAAALLRPMWLDPKRGRVARSAVSHRVGHAAGFRQKVTIGVYQRQASGPVFAAV